MWKIENQLQIKLVIAEIKNVEVNNNLVAFSHINSLANEYLDLYRGDSIGNVPGVSNVRKLFRKIGVDPTKHRPSSEALLNRALKQKDFFTVNNIVDVCNWCSLDFLLPICAYDSDKIQSDVVLRLGNIHDKYLALNNREISLENRYLLADSIGAFGSPITDSVRTAVDEHSKNISIVIFAPQEYDTQKLDQLLNIFIDRIIGDSAGRCTFREILS